MRIEKIELAKKIGQLKGVVPSRTSTPALKGILYRDGYLIASDTDLTVKAKFKDVQENPEPFIIPETAFDLITSLPDGEMELEAGEEQVVITSGKIRNKFRTMPAGKFSYARDSISADAAADIPSDRLMAAIANVIHAVQPGSGSVINGMYMECKEGKLNFVALDMHRIAWDCMEYGGDFDMIIPRAALEKLVKLDFSGRVSISSDKNGALFASEEYEVYTRLIQGKYPNYASAVKEGSITAVINRKSFAEAVHRAKLCGSAESRSPIILSLDGPRINVSYKSAAAEYDEDVPVKEPFGKRMRIAFNPTLLMEGLKVFKSDEVTMEFDSPKSPVIIRPKGSKDSSLTELILPVEMKGV